MKKIILPIFLLFILCEVGYAQLAKDSWAVGFGFRYPKLVSVNIDPVNTNYGGFASIQRNFSEHSGLRFIASYSHMEGEYVNAALATVTSTTDAITGNLDLLFYLMPCESVSPYVYGGIGAVYAMLDSYVTTTLDDNQFIPEVNFGAGAEWNFDGEWRLVTEFGYHIANNSDLDGAIGVGEVSGRDTYLGINIGLLYFFEKGEPSKYCQFYSGLSAMEKPEPVDYARIEEMIKRHIPQEVVKEVVVEKPGGMMAAPEKWVLVGVNFEFNSAKITPESYPILFDAAKTLLSFTDLKVEIQGYTDNIGSESYNKTLSQKRADAVKLYLTSKGVSESRLKAVGYGESNPAADNKTADGRAMNRRIEFKVQ